MIEPEITFANVYRYALPLSDGSAAGDAGTSREGALLELGDEEGNRGWGEAAPLPGFSRESADDAARQLLALRGRGAAGEEPYPSVRFALEQARLSLRAAASSEALPRLLSAAPRGTVELNALISAPEDVTAEARRAREAEYRAAKLKVGRIPVEEAVELVRRVSGELSGVSLRLDANRAWSVEEALAFARGVEGIEIEYVEEPLSDSARLPRFAEESGLPVALDESLVGMHTSGLAEHGYVSAVVLKPTLLGGLSRSLALAARADDLGMKAVVSSAFESGVGVLGLVALAAALPGEGAPAGLDTYRWLGSDVLRPALRLGPELDVAEVFEVNRGLEPRFLEPMETER